MKIEIDLIDNKLQPCQGILGLGSHAIQPMNLIDLVPIDFVRGIHTTSLYTFAA